MLTGQMGYAGLVNTTTELPEVLAGNSRVTIWTDAAVTGS